LQGEAFEKRLAWLVELFQLKDILNRPIGKLSGGQRRRVDVARALLHEPKILILDEPTTGLDPQTRKTVWEIIENLRKEQGLTVFLTTHYMEEAADADYVVILDGGKIAAEGTPLALKNQYTGDYLTIYGVSEEQIRTLETPFEKLAQGYRISLENTAKATELIVKHPEIFVDYEIIKGKMDDVFLNATGKDLGGEKV
jgi:multidrug/hemolysin transport system ATP-binding protein